MPEKEIAARLRAERKARGLTVADLAELFRDVASERVARRLPALKDLERTIRGHEAGEHVAGPRYRILYARAFGIPEQQLFASGSDDAERLAFVARDPARLDAVVVDGLAATLAGQRRIEDVVGARAVLGAASGHLELVLHLLRGARGALGGRLAAIASEASQFNGWLNTATGAHASAGGLFDQALRLGMRAGDEDLAATALSMRGHLAWACGDYGDMADLSAAAARLARAAGTRAVATQQRGRALALLGERQEALRAVGQAEDILAGGSSHEDPDGLYFYGAEMLAMQRGLILRYLGEHEAAAEAITKGIQGMPEAIQGSEWVAWYRVQAAAARAATGELQESVSELRVALGTLSSTGGKKTLTDVAQVRDSLAERYPGHSTVDELSELLAAVKG
ncbi:hypothetical protein [Actinomadura terrae]|uniref:hypothetical protein n=1 Tax=Actinomadura terrae TaxID=604353 RepID=UPI001FA7D887|nr:hypothetical protein [Actinomadura terrae]